MMCRGYKARKDKVSLDADYVMGVSAYNITNDLESMANNCAWFAR
jgi:hypothetical protein